MQVASGRFCDMLRDCMGICDDTDCLRDVRDWYTQRRASRGGQDKRKLKKIIPEYNEVIDTCGNLPIK
jgi:hypothetical protein